MVTLGLQLVRLINLLHVEMPPKPEPVAGDEGKEVAESKLRQEREQAEAARRAEEESRRASASHTKPEDKGKGPLIPEDSGHTVNDIDFSMLESHVAQAARMYTRFKKLQAIAEKNMTANELKNGGFETGRPKARIADHMKGDSASAFTSPSFDYMQSMKLQSESIAVATAEIIARITAKWSNMGMPTVDTMWTCIALARYCADVGSSPYMNPSGSLEFPSGGAMTRDTAVSIVREYCSLRAFCRMYARCVWAQMLITEIPPAGWQAKGYPKEARYAAFDTFDYVTNSSTVAPLDGVLREPTAVELNAHATHKALAINKSRRNYRYANFSHEVTSGKHDEPGNLIPGRND